MTYRFDPTTPPLMKNGQHPLTTPVIERQIEIGKAEWDEVKVTVPIGVLEGTIRRTHYLAIRTLIWIADETVRWAVDKADSKERTTGYDKETHQKLERTLELGASAELPLAKLNANVKATLKITEEINEKWHQEIVEKSSWLYKKETTYTIWKLVDNFQINKSYTEEYYLVGKPTGRSAVIDVPPIDAQCVLSYYEDSIEDKKMTVFSEIAHI